MNRLKPSAHTPGSRRGGQGMSGHTPGPWSLVSGIDRGEIYGARGTSADITDEFHRHIATVYTSKANASLIARAPEMADEIERLKRVNAQMLGELRDIVGAAEQLRNCTCGTPDRPLTAEQEDALHFIQSAIVSSLNTIAAAEETE